MELCRPRDGLAKVHLVVAGAAVRARLAADVSAVREPGVAPKERRASELRERRVAADAELVGLRVGLQQGQAQGAVVPVMVKAEPRQEPPA